MNLRKYLILKGASGEKFQFTAEFVPADLMGILVLVATDDGLIRRYRNMLHRIETTIPYESLATDRMISLSHGQLGWFNWARVSLLFFAVSSALVMIFEPQSSPVFKCLAILPWLLGAAVFSLLAFVKKEFIAFFDSMGNMLFEIRDTQHNHEFCDHLRTLVEIADMTMPAYRVEEEEPLD